MSYLRKKTHVFWLLHFSSGIFQRKFVNHQKVVHRIPLSVDEIINRGETPKQRFRGFSWPNPWGSKIHATFDFWNLDVCLPSDSQIPTPFLAALWQMGCILFVYIYIYLIYPSPGCQSPTGWHYVVRKKGFQPEPSFAGPEKEHPKTNIYLFMNPESGWFSTSGKLVVWIGNLGL